MGALINAAARIAAVAHAGQMRKEEPVPYIAHPIAVALLLSCHGFPEEVIAAGLLHDVLEDTTYPPETLREAVGEEVYALVTIVSNDALLPWEEKKRAYIKALRTAPEGAKAIATADKIHNAESLLAAHQQQGASVWAFFNAGRKKKLWFENAMLNMLQETWAHPLVDEYAVLVKRLNALD